MKGIGSAVKAATRAGGLAFALALLSGRHAAAADLATLQIAIAVPDPVVAGETLSFQVLAVNIGDQTWAENAYYWEAELYDLDMKYLTKTDRVYPAGAAAPGGTSATTLKFIVPENFLGRKFYRVTLGHQERRLVQSEPTTFEVIERPILPPPVTPYRFGGNLSLSASRSATRGAFGSTTLNMIGKIREASFLLNTYFLHDKSHLLDPYIVLGSYYAPWGTVSAGDVSPSFNPLALEGQGVRGAMLEQTKAWDRWTGTWTLVYGRASKEKTGSAATDGRYARNILGAKLGLQTPWRVAFDLNYVLGEDDEGSLSADPLAGNFRGPNLRPQRNPILGGVVRWTPFKDFELKGAYQKAEHLADTAVSTAPVSATATRAEVAFKRGMFKGKAFLQKTGKGYVSFGSPTAISDRQTMEVQAGLSPLSWLSFSGSLNAFKDNLAKTPGKLTTEQKVMNGGTSIRLPTSTSLTLGFSNNAAVGDPKTSLDNQTTTISAGAAQNLGPHYLSVTMQNSQFKDANKIAHDLQTGTLGMNGNLKLPGKVSTSFGVTNSNTDDKVDGSKRTSRTVSGSLGLPLSGRLFLQAWGSLISSESTSTTAPSDSQTRSANLEATFQSNDKLGYTLAVGQNQTTDRVLPANDKSELTLTLRLSFNF